MKLDFTSAEHPMGFESHSLCQHKKGAAPKWRAPSVFVLEISGEGFLVGF